MAGMYGLENFCFTPLRGFCNVCTCLGRIFATRCVWVGVVFCGCFRLFTVLGRPIYAVFSCVHWHNTVYQKSVAAKITKAKLKVLSREFKQ